MIRGCPHPFHDATPPEQQETSERVCTCDSTGGISTCPAHGRYPHRPATPETSERVEPETWTIWRCEGCGWLTLGGPDEYDENRHGKCLPSCPGGCMERIEVTRLSALAQERERRQRAENELALPVHDRLAILTTRAEAAEAEARTERERREEAERDGATLFEVEAVLDDLHPECHDEKTADWLRRALRIREARAETAEARLASLQERVEELERALRAIADGSWEVELMARNPDAEFRTMSIPRDSSIRVLARSALSTPDPNPRPPSTGRDDAPSETERGGT